MPVRPSWVDDGDLLGYVDSIHNIYIPGESGIINTLVEANKEVNLHKLYIICFDEMNLARVEHYFAQFLSVLEMDSGQRKLKLYNKELESRLYNSIAFPSSINIGENILFVGTVNIDESTYHFSDKVLDRANVIRLSMMPFENLKNMKLEKRQKGKVEEVFFTKYKEYINTESDIELSGKEIQFFDEMNVEIGKINSNLGIGYRIVKQIDRYLKNIPENTILNRETALDLQVVQRILTKVRGSQEQLVEFIGEYDTKTDKLSDSKIEEILDKYNEISSFMKTREVIKNKAKELKIYGYTI